MQYRLEDLEYKTSGKGRPILCLHGWGTDMNAFDALTEKLTDRFRFYSISFPGFGGSPEPAVPWGVEDYAELTERFVRERIGETPFAVIAHSFGGRVASLIEGYEKLLLIGAAGIRSGRSPVYYFKVYGYKLLKLLSKIPLLGAMFRRPLAAYRRLYASADYSRASEIMKATLSKVVNRDLSDRFARITVPTLLIWGENDDQTPLDQGKRLHQLIAGSGLTIFRNAGHFVYLEKPDEVREIALCFLTADPSETPSGPTVKSEVIL